MAEPESASLGSTTMKIQFPCSGNELALGWQEGNNSSTNRITGITDSNSNTWKNTAISISANTDAQLKWWYAGSDTGTFACSNSETITITTGGMSNPEYNLFDIQNSGGLDTSFGSATCGANDPAGCTAGAANGTATTSATTPTTFNATTGTPSQANGVILGQVNEGQGVGYAMSPGYFLPYCSDNTTTLGCNQALNGSGAAGSQDGGLSIYYNLNTSSVTTTYSIYTTISINEWWASSIAFKP